MKKILAVIPAALLSLSAHAQGSAGEFDAYLWKAGPGADGFGVKGQLNMFPLFFAGQMQTGEVGAVDADELRIGAGILGRGTAQILPYARLEIVNFDAGAAGGDETGVGLQAGLQWKPIPSLNVRAEAGYVDVAAFDSSEFLYGMSWEYSRPFAFLIERREAALTPPETHFGVRITF